jgi:hypothetical protein
MTEGTKYHPLFEHLLFSGQGRLSMTFAEIEAVLGAHLPPSARLREEWWSNNPNGHSQARAWLRANYRTSSIDLAEQTVVFSLEGWPKGYGKVSWFRRLTEEGSKGMNMAEGPQAVYEAAQDRLSTSTAPAHPLFGIWKGKVTLLPGQDYTEPAFDPTQDRD